MDLLQRLKEILNYSGLSTRAFANKCGISQPTLDKQLKGLRSVSLDTTMAVLSTFHEVSAEWLMRGNGQMIISSEGSSPELERINKLVDTITTLQDTINLRNETISLLTAQLNKLNPQSK